MEVTSESFELSDYTSNNIEGAIELGSLTVRAVHLVRDDGVTTYVYLHGRVIAAITSPEAAERQEHADEVMAQPQQHEATVPVLVRTVGPRRRFLGIF